MEIFFELLYENIEDENMNESIKKKFFDLVAKIFQF